MKALYSTLIGIVVFFLLASLATADPWDKRIVNRFTPVITGVTVLDEETGLVWEVNPSTALRNWVDAQFDCYNRTRGGRKGWRLPTIHELTSLIDPQQHNPTLPIGHPFQNIKFGTHGQGFPDRYWSATFSEADHPPVVEGISVLAWFATFSDEPGTPTVSSTNNDEFAWCVRGGQAAPITRWDKRINNANQRFKNALLNPTIPVDPSPEAILDNETGLVWELAPSALKLDWFAAIGNFDGCAAKTVGGRS